VSDPCIQTPQWTEIALNCLSTLGAGLVSALVAWIIGKSTLRSQNLTQLEESLRELNRLSLKYPDFEDDDFCTKWSSKKKGNIRQRRYDSYCCLAFNFLQNVWNHFDGNKSKIEQYFGISEMINRHQTWWFDPGNVADNREGYPEGFRTFIGEYIK
jgi:hypothetical protein